MATYYRPHFLWLPKRLIGGRWAWLRKVQKISHGGTHQYRDYARAAITRADKGGA